MIENEFKVMLTEEQYNVIRSMYEWDRVTEQTNHYYDTAEMQLVKAHITCRVREIKGVHYLQMKLPTGVEFSRTELEKQLGEQLPESLSAEMLNALSGRSDMPDVKRLGSLTTHRSIKQLDGAEIDLDKSSYFGKTDYELEIEFTDETAARRLLAEIKAAAGIESSGEVSLGKIHRFLRVAGLGNEE